MDTSRPIRPRVHNVGAARADRPIYARLYKITADVAQPVISDAVVRTTAGEATELIHEELQMLKGFLLQLEEPLPDTHTEENRALLNGLNAYLKESLEKGDDTRVDETLCRELSEEFARVLWSSWLRRMRAHAKDGTVDPRDLLPANEAASSDGQWEDIHLAVRHFQISPKELKDILTAVLTRLLKETPEESSTIELPLGLSIDRSALVELLDPRESGFEGGSGGRSWSIGDVLREILPSKSRSR